MLCGENLLPITVMVYVPAASPMVLKSNSLSPLGSYQWNLFPSSLSSSGGKETKFPLESVFASDELAVLSRMGGPLGVKQLPPANNWNVTSISCPTLNVCDVGDLKQKTLVWLAGSSRATTLDRPGVFPTIVGSLRGSK